MGKLVVPRRLFLRGAGGFSLALPFLPSVALPGRTLGAPAVPRPKYFVGFMTGHGGIAPENMYPAATDQQMAIAPGHTINFARLKRTLNGTMATISPVLSAPADKLTDRLASKLNVMRGLDQAWHAGHNTAGLNNGRGASIDQLMAWSPSFYQDLSGIKMRSLVCNNSISYSYSNPGASNPALRGPATQLRTTPGGPLDIFNSIVAPPPDTSAANPRKPVVDWVLEDYKRLRNGNRRMAAPDRQRLDDHMGRLAELERRVTARAPGSCAAAKKPTSNSGFRYEDGTTTVDRARADHALYNDLFVSVFTCGTSRIATTSVNYNFAANPFGDWHQNVAHMDRLPDRQLKLVEGLRNVFEYVMLDLASKLDIDDGTGSTYLDNTLIHWSQECGMDTHGSDSIPVVTMGSAGGFFKTGQFVDYRNQIPSALFKYQTNAFVRYRGLLYNRWMGTVLQGMGLKRTEYESGGVPGYGRSDIYVDFAPAYTPDVVRASSGDPLPVITG